jgi:hypothetical protein
LFYEAVQALKANPQRRGELQGVLEVKQKMYIKV